MNVLKTLLALFMSLQTLAYTLPLDPDRTAATPNLSRLKTGEVMLTWTEKDSGGMQYYYAAFSKDNGKNFSDKKLIFSHEGIGSSRLMKPKVLEKGDGTLVAVFSLRETTSATAATAQDNHAGGHASHEAVTKPAPAKGGRPRDMKIMYSYSKDHGTTWSVPAPVHQDQTAGVVRGFFDSAVMANGEIAVAFLQDIPDKPHSRDMRLVTSKGLAFDQEKVIDDFTCDCCNISLLTDAKGNLNVFYRENSDNIRDIARMTSSDNGKSFSKPSILLADQWQINGCPHSGPTSSTLGNGSVAAWYSGSEDAPGLRIVTGQGKRLAVIGDPSAKNAFLVPATATASVLLWEQNQPGSEESTSYIAYRKVTELAAGDVQWVKASKMGHSPTGVYVGNQLLVAYEAEKGNNQNTIELSLMPL
jgi:hypothetical protein